MDRVERKRERENERRKEEDQANLRRADDLLSHKITDLSLKTKSKIKSEMSFEDDQVSDFTRRC